MAEPLAEPQADGVPRGSTKDRGGGVVILGVQVSSDPFEKTARRVVQLATSETRDRAAGPSFVCATSVHGLIVASEDLKFRDILNRATTEGIACVPFHQPHGCHVDGRSVLGAQPDYRRAFDREGTDIDLDPMGSRLVVVGVARGTHELYPLTRPRLG